MVGTREVAVSVLAFTTCGSAFRCTQVKNVIQIHVGIRHKGNTAAANERRPRHRRPRPRAWTAVRMVSEREEELKDKIAKLRGAASKGETYERVVGRGSDLTGES